MGLGWNEHDSSSSGEKFRTIRLFILIQGQADLNELADEIAAIPGIEAVHRVTGAYDVIAEAVAAEGTSLWSDMIENIRAIAGVIRALPCSVGASARPRS